MMKEVTEGREVAVQERLASGEDDLAHAEVAKRDAVAFEADSLKFGGGVALPDVAHDAAAVATAVDVEDENGERGDDGLC